MFTYFLPATVYMINRHQPTSGVIPPSRLHADKRDNMPPHLEGRGRSTFSPVKLDDVRKVKGDNNVEGERVSLHMVTQDPSEMDLDEKDTLTTAAVHQELKSLPRLMNASNLLEDDSQENMNRLPPPSAGAPSALPICSESQGTVLLRSLIKSEDSFAAASTVILKGASFQSFSSHHPLALTQSRSNPLSSGSPATGPQSHWMDHLLDADQVLLVRTMSGIKDKEKWTPMPIARGGTSIASHSDDVVSLQPQEKKGEQNPGVAHVDGHYGFHDSISIRMLLEDLDWAAQGRHKPRTPGVLRRAVMDLVAEEIQPLCTSGLLKKSDARNAGKAAVELVLKVLPAFGSGSSYDSEKGITEFVTPARVAKVKQLALHSTQHLWKSQGVSYRNEGVS
ncbi:hypothetical protein CEUSTIGMA_g8524.t1 [Chlamydomonas eustigma]|uniref:Uncharacterized protein n=1 Tax=Chlamydomonas eustigma TaxID=1157962 RepID=A0A250XEA3_9CHLO|nr:hypothetical protein CEUSTIGMA_g8524.t1 [Chlamydomonas eustigma]|eukprot:GAX81090.1 hypothetical protein CEUSTIGMA_g8524.t1 [Chlamydomonas eustigma]